MSPRVIDKEAKKFQILHAALHVFARNGIANTKMIEIAKEASVGKGTIYEYFRSKEEIFSEAFKAMFGGMSDMLQNAIKPLKDPVGKLEKIVEITLTYFQHDASGFMGIMMDFWAEGIRTKNEKMLEIVNLQKIYADYRELIGNIVKEGIKLKIFKKIDVVAYAAITIAALDGILLQIIMDPGLININQVKKTFSETLIFSLKIDSSSVVSSSKDGI